MVLKWALGCHLIPLPVKVSWNVPCSYRAWVCQHLPVHHPKNPVLGFHGWDETVPQRSVYLVSSFLFFFSHAFFFLPLIFFLGLHFLSLFFLSRHPWTQNFSLELLPTPPPICSPPPSPEAQRASRACGELMELGELGKLVELMESLWNLRRFWNLESLWSLWRLGN